ncbi:MAG TPA: aminopeptidase P N-terminal domain-containing protein [Longimicrobiales bacterium]|nr:aminopeptidase P N-terminal domain-containing protein [Longimicrobiales bacterium]
MNPKDSNHRSRSVFERRRAAVFERLGAGVMVLPAAPIQYRSRDTEIPYRPDSELYYVTGATEPGTVAVLVGGTSPSFQLFVRDRDSEAELWSGPRLGAVGAAERFGADETHPVSELAFRVPQLLKTADRIHFRLGRGDEVESLVRNALVQARARGPRTGTGPRGLTDPGEILDELRLRKDAHEIQCLRAAAALSIEGHLAGVAELKAGAGEWRVEASVNAAFRRGGGTGPGYGTIVGSGPNACVLHYVANSRVMEKGDLVLLDAGAELGMYQGDVTRTYPVDGVFSGRQRAVYEVVERARAAAVEAVAPGASLAEIHGSAVRVVVEGLVSMGVLKGDLEELVATDAHRPWFPHQTSHWLGLDVHDPGDCARDGSPRLLEPGMTFTVEPGLYFPADSEEGAAAFAGIGVRVEDDVVVTEDGHDNLTRALPTAPDDIEALVRSLR